MPDRGAARPFRFRLALGLPLAAMAALLWIDPTPIDFALARALYTPGRGFIGAGSHLLETVLHQGVRQLTTGLLLALAAALLASPWLPRLRPWRARLGYLVLAIALSAGIVPPLKALTAVHCPWDLAEFGGQEIHTPLLAPRAPTGHPGRCWPGGHASSGFALCALFFALRDARPRLARGALAGALALGSVLSASRMMQGAHFLSHNLWTLLLDWTLCALLYRCMLWRGAPLFPAPLRPIARRICPARPRAPLSSGRPTAPPDPG